MEDLSSPGKSLADLQELLEPLFDTQPLDPVLFEDNLAKVMALEGTMQAQ